MYNIGIGLMATAVVAGALHEGTPPKACNHEEFCPEPDQAPADSKERGRPSPAGPGRIAAVTTGPTGQMNITTSSGSMGFISAAPQVQNDVYPNLLVTTLASKV